MSSAAGSLVSPPKSILKWFLKDVQERPTIKVSPIFEMEVPQSKEEVQLSLTNNNDIIQIMVKPVGKLNPKQLGALIAEASLIFRFSGNESKTFDKWGTRVSGEQIVFDVTRLKFSEVTNNYEESFAIEVHLHWKSADAVQSNKPSLTTQGVAASQSSNELVRILWKMTDTKELPLIKYSPKFSFNVGEVPHNVRLSMDTNNDRIQIRIHPLKEIDPKIFAESINNIEIVFHPDNNGSAVQSEDCVVRKVAKDGIYLTTSKLSFAKITNNYQNLLEVAIQLNIRKRWKSLGNPQVPTESPKPTESLKPFTFDWEIVDYDMYPLTKTSPKFRLEMGDKSMFNVQFLVKHSRDESIQLFMSTPNDTKKLTSSIDRATIKITDANGMERQFQDVVPKLVPDNLISLDLPENNLKFIDLTNQFKSSFRIVLILHRLSTSSDVNTRTDYPTGNPIATLFAPNPLPTPFLCQLNKLLVDQIDCNVFFDCQGTRIGAHRSILQARSAFFNELLLQHKNQTLFPFKSVDAETMADTLQFIYTANAPRIAITAERLLSVANLMELPELHELAQQQLLQKGPVPANASSSQESIAKLLDLFQDKKLQSQVGMFIRTHLDEFLTNPHFERELKLRPDVCYELMVWIYGANKLPG